ncbi:MAG: hypothetical protein JW995_12175 [Melioribacteraceae bacterium]|nr:hypothetical protein [Melioribacteraceae bacterium]
MSRGKFLITIVLIVLVSATNYYACTTAIVSGKFTDDGRPLLFKHRDASFEQNRLMFFDDGRFTYIGMVNSVDTDGKEVWGGSNSAGFAIINSASYNLKSENDTSALIDREGIIMKIALQNCKTVEDFEELLNNLDKPLGVETNFGVIDAYGGCAYFECNNFNYTIIDANDPSVAPFGYLIRTNYSFNGPQEKGYGYIRYLTAEQLFYNAAATNNLNYRFLLQDVSRCLKHSLIGVDLRKNNYTEFERTFVTFEDYIVRYSSVSTILVHGVKKGESPKLTTIWTILGFQLSSVAMPVWVDAGKNLPSGLIADGSGLAPICDKALMLKRKCFPVSRGSGKKYLDVSVVINDKNTGFLQEILPVEKEIFDLSDEKIKKWRTLVHIPKQEAQNFYNSVNEIVTGFLDSLINKH